MPPAPCAIGSRITAASSSRVRARSARASSSACALVPGLVETAGRARREQLLAAARRRTAPCMPVTGSHTPSRRTCRRDSRRAARAGAASPARRARCQNCSAILIATSTATEPESQRNTRSAARREPTQPLASATAGSCVSPPNITCGSPLELAAHGRVQARVVVAVDRRPPRRHAVHSSRPSSSSIRTPDAERTGKSGSARGGAYGCQTASRSRAMSEAASRSGIGARRYRLPV